MGAGDGWTDEAILRESGRWVHVPSEGTRIEDARRLLVHLPKSWRTSRVWRSWAVDERRAGDLIDETIGEVRASGGERLVWHTGDRISPPFMDECLAAHGFELAEDLDVLAFVLIDDSGPRLPRLGTTECIDARLVRDAAELREVLGVDSDIFGSPQPSGVEFAEYDGELEKLRRFESGRSPSPGDSIALRFAASVDIGPGGEDARRTVAAAGAQLVGETLRLWGAATLEAFRRRGAYRALVLERCRFGMDLGATLALTKANAATSSLILQRAGFRRVGKERRHVREI